MDLRLREVTWVRLLSLLIWTILVMLKRGITYLIDAIEGGVFERVEQRSKKKVGERATGVATLLLPLSDELVITRVWPLLHRKVDVSLLWRLRRVNRAWKRNVATSLEWAALEIVRVDAPGYLQYLRDRHERRPSLQERVEDELRSLSVLLSECLTDFTLQSEAVRSGSQNFGKRDRDRNPIEDLGDVACDCVWTECPCVDRFNNNYDRVCGHSEIETEVEACVSTSESSMSVIFPRHLQRT
jgi:hypothetical protein